MSTVGIVSLVLAWLVIATLTVVVLSLVRQVADLRLQLGGGAVAMPDRAVLDLYDEPEPAVLPLLGGGSRTLGGVAERPLVALVYAPGCATCEGAEEQLAALAARESGLDVLAVIGLPRAEAAAHAADSPLLAEVPSAALEDLPVAWDPPETPWAIALTAEGVVAAVGRPRTLLELFEVVHAAEEAVLSAGPGSVREHSWGVSVPYWPASGDPLEIHHVEGTDVRD